MNIKHIYHHCTGCGLCQSVFGNQKVQLSVDTDGFYHPKFGQTFSIVDKILLEGFCPAVSIVKYQYEKKNRFVLWGNIINCFVAYSTNEIIRKEASSGGAITTILNYLLNNKLIDAAIQIGPDANNPVINKVYSNICLEDLLKCSNSRYSPSAPLINITNTIKPGKKYAIVGKPCDIYAIRRYNNINNKYVCNNIYYISFFCAGIPSYRGTEEVLSKLGVEYKSVSNIYYRKDGWPGGFKVITKGNEVFTMAYNDSWGKILNKYLPFRCKICPDGIGEFADIVCADAWQDYDGKGYPTFENREGLSLLISRTDKGSEIVNKVMNDGYINNYKTINDYDNIDKMQPYQALRRKWLYARILALKLLFYRIPKYDKYIMNKQAIVTIEFWKTFAKYYFRYFEQRINHFRNL